MSRGRRVYLFVERPDDLTDRDLWIPVPPGEQEWWVEEAR